MKNNNAFELERHRASLAHDNLLKELLKTYNSSQPTISGKNTKTLWDDLNLNFYYDDMAKDRTITAKNWLKKNKGKVLNIGFGSGCLEKEYFSSNHNQTTWYGIDISPWSVKNLKEMFPKSNFSEGNVLNLKFKDGYFSSVAILEVMEHVSPTKTFIAWKEINRILKKKGSLIVSVPLNENLEEMVKHGMNPNAHVRVYTKELIKAELILAGFEIKNEKIFYAFPKHYYVKKLVTSIFPNIRKPNNVIILAQKK